MSHVRDFVLSSAGLTAWEELAARTSCMNPISETLLPERQRAIPGRHHFDAPALSRIALESSGTTTHRQSASFRRRNRYEQGHQRRCRSRRAQQHVNAISAVINGLLADTFALCQKTKKLLCSERFSKQETIPSKNTSSLAIINHAKVFLPSDGQRSGA